MMLVRVLATLFLLATGWMLRRRPILGPLVLLLVGAGLIKLWRGTGHDAVARHGYRALALHPERSRR